MMRVLLAYPYDPRDYWCIPPLSLGYIAQGLIVNGFKGDIFIEDLRKEKIPPENFSSYVKRKYGRVDFIGFQSFSPVISIVNRYVEEYRKENPDCIFAVGGPHAIFETEDCFLRIPNLHYAFLGEAEESLPQILRGEEPDSNYAYRINGKIIKKRRVFLENLDRYPMPAWEIMPDPSKYPLRPVGFFTRGRKVAPVIATRGCPYNCSYCGAPQASGKKIRKRSPELVAKEVEMLVSKYGIDEIHFLDDNLTFDREYALSICKYMKDIGVPWGCPNGVRLDRLDPELVIEMEKSGCYAFSVGVESGSERILKLMRRGGDVLEKQKIRKQIEMIKRYTKIRVTAFFILGFPGATYDDDIETINFALSLPIDHAAFGCFAPLPGSAEWEKLKLQRKTPDPSSLCIWKFSYVPEGRTKKELDLLKLRAFVSFYARPKYIWNFVKGVKSFDQVKMVMKRFLDNK